jgi:protein tyrosine/serine phosphatase
VFRKVLLHIASLPISPFEDSTQPAFLIHCTTGNNRTGVFVGILLSLLRVPPASIASEYALSQLGLAPSRPAVVARLLKNPIFNGDRARCERMVGAREESMLAMLESVRVKWGSAEGYVRECCGLSKEEVNAVRRVLGAQYEIPSLFRRMANVLLQS